LLQSQSLIGFGSNLGLKSDRRHLTPADVIVHSLARLESAGFAVIAVSSVWRSPAWPPGRAGQDYANAVALVDAGRATPHQQLERLQGIEHAFGRQRDPADQWAPRTLDLDLLDCAGVVLESAQLTLPHPRIAARAFVLGPLIQVAPDWTDPVTGEAGGALLARLLADPGPAGVDARAAEPVTVPLLEDSALSSRPQRSVEPGPLDLRSQPLEVPDRLWHPG
jgi:2-amino-4-hydroxy-6-hydroxymethyldihydropteridine diphosphokinase